MIKSLNNILKNKLPNEKKGLSLQLKLNDFITNLNPLILSQTSYQCHSQYKSFK